MIVGATFHGGGADSKGGKLNCFSSQLPIYPNARTAMDRAPEMGVRSFDFPLEAGAATTVNSTTNDYGQLHNKEVICG